MRFSSDQVRTPNGWLVVAAAAAILLGGCGSSGASTASPLSASGAYVNEPTTPDKTGAFVTITNSGTSAVTLTQVTVPASDAESASLHETVSVGGSMEMRPVDGIAVPAGGQVVLKPGGLHIMLMRPTVQVGGVVPLTLVFGDGTTITTDAPVKAAAASMSPSG